MVALSINDRGRQDKRWHGALAVGAVGMAEFWGPRVRRRNVRQCGAMCGLAGSGGARPVGITVTRNYGENYGDTCINPQTIDAQPAPA